MEANQISIDLTLETTGFVPDTIESNEFKLLNREDKHLEPLKSWPTNYLVEEKQLAKAVTTSEDEITSSVTTSEEMWENSYPLLREDERLKTFTGWQNDFVNSEDLAKAGFFYFGEKDNVKCFYCDGVLEQWVKGDVPIIEHRRHFPECPFVNGSNVYNIPIVDEKNPAPNLPPDNTRGADGGGEYKYEMQKFSRPEKLTNRKTMMTTTSKKVSYLGFDEVNMPKNPNVSISAGNHVSLAELDIRRAESSFRDFDSLLHMCLDFQHDDNQKSFNDVNLPSTAPMAEIPHKSLTHSESFAPTMTGVSEMSYDDLVCKEEFTMGDYTDKTVCKLCLNAEIEVLFLPCAHFLTCRQCARYLEKCPLCRQGITGSMRVFLS